MKRAACQGNNADDNDTFLRSYVFLQDIFLRGNNYLSLSKQYNAKIHHKAIIFKGKAAVSSNTDNISQSFDEVSETFQNQILSLDFDLKFLYKKNEISVAQFYKGSQKIEVLKNKLAEFREIKSLEKKISLHQDISLTFNFSELSYNELVLIDEFMHNKTLFLNHYLKLLQKIFEKSENAINGSYGSFRLTYILGALRKNIIDITNNYKKQLFIKNALEKKISTYIAGINDCIENEIEDYNLLSLLKELRSFEKNILFLIARNQKEKESINWKFKWLKLLGGKIRSYGNYKLNWFKHGVSP